MRELLLDAINLFLNTENEVRSVSCAFAERRIVYV